MASNPVAERKPFTPEWRVLVGLGALLILAAWLFFDIVDDMVIDDPLVPADAMTYATLRALRTPGLDSVMITITEAGDTLVTLVVTIAVAAWLAREKAWRAMIYWLTAIAGGSAISSVVKLALRRPRPVEMYHSGWDQFSFPSGHSTVNLVIYGFLAIIVGRQLTPLWRVITAGAALTLVAVIAFSRLYLGAHWLSDVCGGLAFGTMWLAFLAIAYLRRAPENISPRNLLLVTLAALTLGAAADITLNRHGDTIRYAVKPTVLQAPK